MVEVQGASVDLLLWEVVTDGWEIRWQVSASCQPDVNVFVYLRETQRKTISPTNPSSFFFFL